MIIEKYEKITKLLARNEVYPYVDNGMNFRGIVRETILECYDKGIENSLKLRYDVIYLGEKQKAKVQHTMYLVVLRLKDTNEYVVFTVTYITNNSNYNAYKFDILDKEGK